MDIDRIGQRIREIRRDRGVTQETLAEAAEISVPYLSCIERGSKNVSLQTLIRFAAALDVTVDRLLVGIQSADKEAFLPEVCELLEECTMLERRAIFEVLKATKDALRVKQGFPHHTLYKI